MNLQEYNKMRHDITDRIAELYYAGAVKRVDGELVYDTGDEEILISDITCAVADFLKHEKEIQSQEQERQGLIIERKKLEDNFDANFLGPKNKGKLEMTRI